VGIGVEVGEGVWVVVAVGVNSVGDDSAVILIGVDSGMTAADFGAVTAAQAVRPSDKIINGRDNHLVNITTSLTAAQ
jgi:hypothetical protein